MCTSKRVSSTGLVFRSGESGYIVLLYTAILTTSQSSSLVPEVVGGVYVYFSGTLTDALASKVDNGSVTVYAVSAKYEDMTIRNSPAVFSIVCDTTMSCIARIPIFLTSALVLSESSCNRRL